MKVTVYSAKGGQGKTPLALNMALHNDWGLCTNEDTPDLHRHLEMGSQLIVVEPDQPFPDLPEDIEVVFDLGGTMKGSIESVQSAVSQSDVVLIPIKAGEQKSLIGGIKTIHEVSQINPNIVVVANMLTKKGSDGSYETGTEFVRIKEAMQVAGVGEYTVLPLKRTTAFEDIYHFNRCLRDLVQSQDDEGKPFLLPMTAYQYRIPEQQFATIMSYLKDNYEQ